MSVIKLQNHIIDRARKTKADLDKLFSDEDEEGAVVDRLVEIAILQAEADRNLYKIHQIYKIQFDHIALLTAHHNLQFLRKEAQEQLIQYESENVIVRPRQLRNLILRIDAEIETHSKTIPKPHFYEETAFD